MFLHIFGALCEKKGESKSAAAKACGLSNSTVTKWKKTQAVPESSTLMKIAEHFNVTVDYLLGATPDSYLLGTEYQLKEAEKAYGKETDPDKRDELGGLIDVLRDSLYDLRLAAAADNKSPATENGDGINGTDDKSELMELYDSFDLSDRARLLAFAQGLRLSRNPHEEAPPKDS